MKRLLALLLVLCLCVGCTPLADLQEQLGMGTYHGVSRPYRPRLPAVSFKEMEYTRPDAEALCQAFADAAQRKTVDAVLTAYDAAYDDYFNFYTLEEIAYIRYTMNLSDSFYQEEFNWCQEQSPLVEQALEDCYRTLAASPLREALEEEYFGDGFFEDYDGEGSYNDQLISLLRQESQLVDQYLRLQASETLVLDGEELPLSEALTDVSDRRYNEIMEEFYRQYNADAAEIYMDLLQVRNRLAQFWGFDCYADYAYSYDYNRDYTIEEVITYTGEVARQLAPLYSGDYTDSELSPEKVLLLLGSGAEALGGEIQAAYEYMMEYDLYDLSASPSKMPGAYTAYLLSYEMPFLFVDTEGSTYDLLSASHEFGHFVDDFLNCHTDSSVDNSEIFSQAMEFLIVDSAALTHSMEKELKQTKLTDILETILTQACFAEFERRAYALSDPDTESLNRLYHSCIEEFGLSTGEFYDEYDWCDVEHFFTAPFYVISYCASADAALQIYQRQVEQGDGLTLYRQLLTDAPDCDFLALLERNGMESPFAPGRVEELAEFLKQQLG